ncbi:CDP-diacylglycerol--glycerol-3-phosphate 3-phosphatidyltransferase [Adhaeretor mobilis]|uniref:CDP-diacylglycerol--glycerol-3-phosphate 3-phosphatidyltransferase n=1 Tax=Adhaeretor mobilis TaxID=1930276 RepID=A0A517MUS1_9BACT|nr:CDP-diacylglycerol--glycerol-3-phosphate 3-phosphatidyltransferase [Adhaeretor mobilis]QDS98625.1 CDP-diacylglycerol--glycerol-3-phosphate 3-phosphatidyltransferase [Adhaeretor mobilis]
MSEFPATPPDLKNPPRIWNVPNQVTMARVVLTLVLFVLLGFNWYVAALVVFLVAAGTDWVDGYWARKYGQVTQLGRILDPFADKLIICGTYIYLCASPMLANGKRASGIAVGVAVLIVGRELLVTALRSFVEGIGGDFSAKWAGKWKMVAQCAAAALAIYQLSYLAPTTSGAIASWQTEPPAWLSTSLTITVWATVLLTIYTGLDYVRDALRFLRAE